MTRVKDIIPDSITLEKRLTTILENGLSDFLKNTKDRRSETRDNLRFAFISFAFFVAICIFLVLSSIKIGTGFIFQSALVLSIIWLGVLLFSGRAWLRNTRLMAREMNMALTPFFSTLFDRLFLYTHNGEQLHRVETLLTTSSLVTIKGLLVKTDDSFEVFAGDNKLEFHELLLTMQGAVNQTSKERLETEVFRGMLMVAVLPESHAAETYISTDGDRYGFAHQSFWTSLLGMGMVQPVELEWNDFENALHVASTDGRIAREFLNPEIMQDIYDWWQEHKLNMRIAIKGNQLYVLIPEDKMRVETSTTSTKLTDIMKYAQTLVRPMWRGLVLIDSVVKR